ncbi:MAG: uroporphyrinogen-III C-methyltransferase [Geminocystis sp.]|nr:uroporphyrinogen-III C-methyltransferase [Geminocystis sp.]MCX8077872.1 uroporphyrinogen-III C-methyltransferase [Geminocystis sp.]MDW8117298.1 uroporphyrinogen-III C-methyltransferase [Geminocystis sp.]MDW8461992.1 uroporphyrinogen-III C-methyltransferase [Geminocystis sp.]HIK36568.1 uroporphyrinogen-III C-methyltransferase [Geminocystis sp. M7585_C2015_104]
MTVYFVGAGIGGLDYLTLKAYKILSQAEVIIHDALIDKEILNIAPENCLKIHVGKRGGQKSTPQAEINRLLAQLAPKYKVVVRLKGGDVGIFGRLIPELATVKAIGVDYQLIPGISSALAAPLLAHIPLTDKDHSSGVMVVSGHNPEKLNWEILSQIDTLVILMGGRNLSLMVEKLQKYGRPPSHPIAIIKEAGGSNTQVWKGTLSTIVAQTLNISLSPCVIVVGTVVDQEELKRL